MTAGAGERVMSTPVVATVAWLALAATIGLGAVLVVLHRRFDALSRAYTDRKWEIATLRAELGAMRRGRDPSGGSGTPPTAPGGTPPGGIPEQSSDPDADGPRAARAWPASPTAWRRHRGRPPVRPPRRRRPG